MRRHRQTQFLAAALLAGACLALASTASAAPAVPAFFSQFPPEGQDAKGAAAGKLDVPVGIASDPSGQRVYVADFGNNRINVFGAWGQFREAFGWGVRTGADELQSCTVQTGCQKGVTGSKGGQFETLQGVTIDAAGDVYVSEIKAGTPGSARVQKFDPTAGPEEDEVEFVWAIGGDVNKTKTEAGGASEAERNLCTAASGDVCQAGSLGSGQSQFNVPAFAAEARTWGDTVEVSPGGDVYVADRGGEGGVRGRIQVFSAGGAFKSQFLLPKSGFAGSAGRPANSPAALAVDAQSGNLYFSFLQSFGEFHSSQPNVYKLSPGGMLLGTLTVDTPAAVASEPASGEGNVFVIESRHTSNEKYTVFEFDSTGALVGAVAEFPAVKVLTGLGTNRIGDLYVANFTDSFTDTTASVKVYGPQPSEIEPAPEVPPTIVDQYPISAGSTDAVVKAKINPHFFGSTTYRVEYGLAPCKEGGCASTLDQSLGGGEKNSPLPTGGVSLPGLTPATTYHFRFIATSGKFTVEGAGEDSEGNPLGLEGTFTTRAPGTPTLPDGRAYEKVSPADKGNGEAGVTSKPLGGGTENAAVRPLQADSSGNGISFASFGAFGDAAGGPAASQYVSRRGESSWMTENITPASRGFVFRDPIRGLSPDLSHSAVVQFDPPLLPEATPHTENLYVRDGAGGLTLLTPEPQGVESPYCISFGGATPSFDRVVFLANGSLTADAPTAPDQSLYEWSREDGLALLSVLPDGTPAIPAPNTGIGARTACLAEGNALNAISEDGSRIFWSYGGSYEGALRPLFARLGGTETIELDLPEGGSGPAGEGQFWAASRDGNFVFFTAPGKLTPGAGSGDLYRYDFSAPEGERLTDLSAGPEAAQILGLLGASEDGTAIYFTAQGVLSGSEVNSEGQKAKAGGNVANIYLWKAGAGIRFIATADPAADISPLRNESPWGFAPFRRTSRVSLDGSLLAFVSVVPLTGFDNRDQESGQADAEVFLYDAAEEELTCASCSPIGARPIGPASLPPWTTPFSQPRHLSEAGAGRLFFQSVDALAQKDTNGKQDVYQFELPGTGGCNVQSPTFSVALGGCQDLISSGEGADDAYLDDASATGDDVFFATRQRLLPSDGDEHYDIYDARVNGGLPEPAPEGECAGEGCRPAPSPPSSPGSPASAAFSGPGNVKEAAKHKKAKKKKRKRQKARRAHVQRGGRR